MRRGEHVVIRKIYKIQKMYNYGGSKPPPYEKWLFAEKSIMSIPKMWNALGDKIIVANMFADEYRAL